MATGEIIDATVLGKRLWILSAAGGSPGKLAGRAIAPEDFSDQNLQVGIAPQTVVPGDGEVWVINGSGQGTAYSATGSGPGFPQENSLTRVSGDTGMREADEAADNPVAAVWTEEGLWFVELAGKASLRLLRQDGSLSDRIELEGTGPVDIAASDDSVWVLTQSGRGAVVTQVDSSSLSPTASHPGVELASLAVDGPDVWGLVQGPASVVVRVAPGRTDAADLQVGHYGQSLAASSGFLWVADEDGRLRGIDPADGTVAMNLHLAEPAHALRAVGSRLIAVEGSHVELVCNH